MFYARENIFFQVVDAHKGRDPNNVVEEGRSEFPGTMAIQDFVCDDVGQQVVHRFLSSEENAQPCYILRNCAISMHPKGEARIKEAYHKQTAFDQRRCLLCENVEYEFVKGILNLSELCIICLAPYDSSTATTDPIYRSRRQFRHRNLLEKLLDWRVEGVSNNQ